MEDINPLLIEFDGAFKTSPFDKLKSEHFVPAFNTVIEESWNKIVEIADSETEPSFVNTVEELEKATIKLGRISSIFFNLNSAETNKEMQSAAQTISPMLTEFNSNILLNENLYKRVKILYNNIDIDDYSTEQKSLLKDYYTSFVRNGADLDNDKRERFVKIKKELSTKTLKFQENVLEETNSFMLHITDADDLKGLPDYAVTAAKQEAESRELEGWVMTLDYPSYIPFMKYADNRQLREKMFRAYTSRSNKGNEYDNNNLIKEIVALRLELANILGYKTYADYVLEQRMALTPDKVNNFISELHDASVEFAVKEKSEVVDFASKSGFTEELQRWDFSYYSEKLKSDKFGFNDEMIKPYFKLENVTRGIFELSEKLYGISFKQVDNIPLYHEDVETYEVYRPDGSFLSLLYMDFFPRKGKQGGAWMTDYCSQYNFGGDDVRPHISIVCNFSKPTTDSPSLLTFDEVTTYLHEFGHALHGMMSECKYPSLSGTSVYRDFVELPSQIMENFAVEKEWLDMFAEHYTTGEKIPADLIKKIIDASNFQAGYLQERQLSFGMNDMAWHTLTDGKVDDVVDFESRAMAPTELFPKVEGSAMSTAFSHIFAGGYAAGYYGYKWAEVLDADAFSVFKERGIFNKDVAGSFCKNILQRGGTDHPMKLYKKFRGKEPSVKALLKRSGLGE
ncbi:MAG: M3 family metallopeptidase [Bacteroidales bacterium]|jgi:peptidyl-dipeptidase Dcp|nr:M3 family metallopeptidase [Bacteroidales bacterium]